VTLTVGSVFAGIGGFDLAFERAGAQVIWNCEIDAKCRSVLQHHWPGIPRFKDVKTVTGAGLGTAGLRPDVLVGGFPCQDVSVAGARAGLAGERSGLFFEFARLLDEIAPEWTVIENVPGLLSSQRGRDMGAVLGVLADLGYVGCWRVLDAQYFGVAQRRRRLFFVGHLGDRARARAVLLEPEGSGGDPPARHPAGQIASALTRNGVGGGGGLDDNAGQANHLIPEPFTFDWQAGGGHDTSWRGKGRSWVVRKPGVSGSLQVNKIEAVAIPDVSTAQDDQQTSQLLPVAYPITPESGQGADLRAAEIDTANGITVDALERSTDRGVRIVQAAYPIARRGRAGEVEMEMGEADIYNALRAGDGGSSRQPEILTPQLAVRRLTPLECLRLQGFPDDWLDGLGLADSVKYRMVGNAVCTSVVYWLARRLLAVAAGRNPNEEVIGVERYIAELHA
jgi:DNA (cytosine-5)-methyltransferase 1